ncbi:MAG: hypothetical protein WC071_05545 [Victivallaceae bacterium]
MKARPYLLKPLPPLWLLLLFFGTIGGSYLIDMAYEIRSNLLPLRCILIVVGTLTFGLWRVIAFYPYPDSRYGKWLALTPWRYWQQLPKGSVQLTITDWLLVATLCATTKLTNGAISVATPAIIFLYAYIGIALFSTLRKTNLNGYWEKRVLILIIIPFAFYPLPSIQATLISLGICYVLCYSHLRDVLKDFPWNTNAWLKSDEALLAQKSLKYLESGWPFSQLASYEKKSFAVISRTFTIILVNALIIWWLHALLNFGCDNPDMSVALSVFLYPFTIVACIIRLAIYLSGAKPPISFWGRILNGYFLIPKYDYVFVTPLCAIAVCVFTEYFMPKSTKYAIWSFEAAVFAILCICMGFPPTLNKWRNTGAFRIIRNKKQENLLSPQTQNTGLNRPINEIIIGK